MPHSCTNPVFTKVREKSQWLNVTILKYIFPIDQHGKGFPNSFASVVRIRHGLIRHRATNFLSFRWAENADGRSDVLPFTVFLRYDEETRPSVGCFVPTRTLLARFHVIQFYGLRFSLFRNFFEMLVAFSIGKQRRAEKGPMTETHDPIIRDQT